MLLANTTPPGLQTDACCERTCIQDGTGAPTGAAASVRVQPEAPQAAGGSPTRSGQRAYLQSLERSSRAWLLSSGKPPGSGVTPRLAEETGSNIWYNPIPEEDDPGGPPAATEIWRRREEAKRAGQDEGQADGPEPMDGSRRPGEADPGPRPEDRREDPGEEN